MAAKNYLMVCSRADGNPYPLNTTKYNIPHGIMVQDPADGTLDRLLVRDAYTVSNLWARVTANGITGNTVVTLMKDGVAQTCTITFTSLQTGTQQDTTHSDAVASGDSVNLRVAVANAGTEIAMPIIATQWQSAVTGVFYTGGGGATVVGQGVTMYLPVLGGTYAGSTTKVNSAYKVEVAGILSNMAQHVYDNTCNVASIGTSLIDGVYAGAGVGQTYTVPAATTGLFEDTTHSEAVAAGQTIGTAFAVGAGAGTVLTGDQHSFRWLSTGQLLGSGVGVYSDRPFGIVRYMTMCDNLNLENATEVNVQTKALIDFTLRNMFVRVITHTLAGGIESKLLGNDAGASIHSTGLIAMSRFQASATGNIVFIKLKATTNANSKVAIYADSAGEPGALLNSTGSVAVVAGWNTIAITSTAVVSGSYYWLAARTDTNGGCMFDGLTGTMRYKALTYASAWPNPAGAGYTADAFNEIVEGYTAAIVAATIALRKNGASAALTVSPNATGIFEDTTHSVDVVSTDLINSVFDSTAASSGTVSLSYLGYQLDQPAVGPVVTVSAAAKLIAAGVI